MQSLALQLVDAFSIDALAFRDVEVHEPGPGEVLVRIHAVSLNYRDLLVVRGQYSSTVQKPLTLCSDCAGQVIATGSGVTAWQPGDRVMAGFFPAWIDGSLTTQAASSALGGADQGVLTTLRVLPEHALVRVPEAFTYSQASCLPCAGVTAWNSLALIDKAGPQSTVLLLGTGGVSIFGLQIAKLLGARTIVTSSSDEKLQRARSMGADETINYRAQPEWDRQVRALTAKQGATHILEVGGAATLPLSLRSAARGGLIAVIGVLSGVEQPMSVLPVLMNGLRVQGVYVGSVQMLQQLADALAAESILPVVDRTFPFSEAQDALRYLETGSHFGKVVIQIPSLENGLKDCMRHLSLLATSLFLGLTMHSQPHKTLASLKDRSRPLLVFEGGDAKSAERQLTMLASHAAAMQERQVVVIGVQGRDKRVPAILLPNEEWEAVQRRFGDSADEFTVILLGKDGGEKLRSHRPIAWETLQKTIDAMPMRKDEAKKDRQ